MAKKKKKTLSEEHKKKLRQRYKERQRAKEQGIILPTRREEAAAAKVKKEPISEQSVTEVIAKPVTDAKGNVFVPHKPATGIKNPAKRFVYNK